MQGASLRTVVEDFFTVAVVASALLMGHRIGTLPGPGAILFVSALP